MMKFRMYFQCFSALVLFVFPVSAQFRQNTDQKFSEKREIRKFDFLNAVYEAGCAGMKVGTRNGHYEPKKTGDGGYFEFDVTVSYGDLTGDQKEEVIVLTQCSGAVQNYDEGKIYTVRNHRLIKIAELEPGAKNRGSLGSAKIKNGVLIVARGPSPDLCTNIAGAAAETAVFRLRSNGSLRKVGKSICTPI
jgi:hypothetical protein